MEERPNRWWNRPFLSTRLVRFQHSQLDAEDAYMFHLEPTLCHAYMCVYICNLRLHNALQASYLYEKNVREKYSIQNPQEARGSENIVFVYTETM